MDTPISVLHLICVYNNTKADYTLLSREGQVHLPTFTYRVQVNNHSEEASGQSKKKARHLAAKKMVLRLLDDPDIIINQDRESILECLKNTVDEPEIEVQNNVLLKSDSAAIDDLTGEISSKLSISGENQTDNNGTITGGAGGDAGNPIGKLQEICMKKHWHPPVYEELQITGLPHERMFTFQCRIENMNLMIDGSGKSKKAAKREAAERMLRMLRDEHLDKFNEILDRIPKRSALDKMQSEGTFDLRNMIMSYQTNTDQNREKNEAKLYNYFRNLSKDRTILEKITEILPDKELDNFIIQYFNGKIIPQIEIFAPLIADLIECRLLTVLHSEKSQTNHFQYWVELISIQPDYKDVSVLSAWGSDYNKDLAKRQALSRLIVYLVFMIQNQIR